LITLNFKNFLTLEQKSTVANLVKLKVPKLEVGGTESLDNLKNFATATLIVSAILKLVMNGALSQVWGMINGLQLFTHMPLFNVIIPPLAMKLVKTTINIATFDIPYINVPDIFG